jgi:hypothetical protein
MVRVAKCHVVPEPLYLWRSANPNSVTKQNKFRYAEASLRACQEEIARTCGLQLTREQMISLRDFWVRFDDPATDWNEVERLMNEISRCYQPPRPTRGWRRKVAVATGGAWFAYAVLELKRGRFARAFSRLAAAGRATGGWMPLAAAQFVGETVSVGGKLCRRS